MAGEGVHWTRTTEILLKDATVDDPVVGNDERMLITLDDPVDVSLTRCAFLDPLS